MSDADPEFAAEDDGGAKKSFWEHLKDLRSALVRSAIAIGAALVICLLLDQQLVAILKFPLQRMEMFSEAARDGDLRVGEKRPGAAYTR